MTRRKLPIGIQTFRKLREDDCYYVDKTAFILRLTREGKHYFLSRPRRFGKSLLIAAICGYTEADLDTVFAAESGLDREEIRDWYNGYNWLGEERVYNPFDILLLFDRREFAAHWFETGTPSFLIDILIKRGVASPELDGMLAGDDLLSAFDVEEMEPAALLFQTGYLTIRDVEDDDGEALYRLGYPNREVRLALNQLLRALSRETRTIAAFEVARA